jgi:23S rRNA pseudouridine1911/1915/1917 synthase
MFNPEDIIYEDNHLIAINKRAGDLVQSAAAGEPGIEQDIKAFLRRRDGKPGDVFLGVAHRIDRPVSGVVVMAKTSKALVRLNEMLKKREIKKIYWAIVEEIPPEDEGTLRHYIARDAKSNRSHAYSSPRGDSKEAVLHYRLLAGSTNYRLVEVDLITGRHHQIRCQLSKVGCPIKGDLKYGAKRSNADGGISLHSRSVEFIHPVRKEPMVITAPVPAGDGLWEFFRASQEVCI